MSIDPQEWSDRRMEAGSDVEATQVHIDLIRAVIADEAAKAAPQPVAAAGDVPEWFRKAVCGGSMSPRKAQALWEQVEREYADRVAEATADKDKKIGELEIACQEIGNTLVLRIDGLRQQLAERDKRIAELEAIVADRSDMVKCVSDANSGLARHRDSLKQQLAASQAEVERLKDQLDCKQVFWDAEIEISKTVTKERDEYFAEIVKLRSEVSRLSRPVEGVPGCSAATFNPELLVVPHAAFLSERNARESAERERDELREAWASYTCGEYTGGSHRAYKLCRSSDARNDTVLAAFRAEKGKVQP